MTKWENPLQQSSKKERTQSLSDIPIAQEKTPPLRLTGEGNSRCMRKLVQTSLTIELKKKKNHVTLRSTHTDNA